MLEQLRHNVRELVATVVAVCAPVLYFIFTETSRAVPYQTAAGHGLLLITLPAGLVLIWLIERRPPAPGRPPTPAWARILLGGATGLLLATAVIIINSFSMGTVKELAGTSKGTEPEPMPFASHAIVELNDGRTVHLLDAFCGVTGSPVMVSFARGSLGLERLINCTVPSLRPPTKDIPESSSGKTK